MPNDPMRRRRNREQLAVPLYSFSHLSIRQVNSGKDLRTYVKYRLVGWIKIRPTDRRLRLDRPTNKIVEVKSKESIQHQHIPFLDDDQEETRGRQVPSEGGKSQHDKKKNTDRKIKKFTSYGPAFNPLLFAPVLCKRFSKCFKPNFNTTTTNDISESKYDE